MTSSNPSPASAADTSWDLVVAGGGAAGFFAAIRCAEALPRPGRILILEKSAKVLAKVRISGGGRCNVTHDCPDPKRLTGSYPRGGRALIGPFHRFGAAETIAWFAARGVELKTEGDGRMFPVTDDSRTIVDCLQGAALEAGVEVVLGEGIDSVERDATGFQIVTTKGRKLSGSTLLLATGGTRSGGGGGLAGTLGHQPIAPVPSLFTFHVEDERLRDLQGLSVPMAKVGITGTRWRSEGPVLVTHWGLSGPGILKLSAWAARELHALDYRFQIEIDWLPGTDPAGTFASLRRESGKRSVRTRSPFPGIPKRLWERLVTAAGLSPETTWAQLPAAGAASLGRQLKEASFQVAGKSLNKDEFVTCGGVPLSEINLRTMESRIQPGLFFAGEVIDVDGITGGFNFQNAWTTGYLAGSAIAAVRGSEREG